MAKRMDLARRKGKRTYKRIAKKDRRNLRLWAEGTRESILNPHIPGYTDALERGWRAERDYVQQVCNEFHARISWRLADDEEPELPLPEYDEFASPDVEVLDEKETATKRERIETLNARISRWLKYRARRLQRPTRMDRSRDPFAILIAKLSGHHAPPKARQGYQQYMHESYHTISPIVDARWAASCVEADGTTLKKKTPDAAFRARIARELFAELSTAEQDGLRSRAKAEAQKAKDEYMAALKRGPSKSPQDRQRCIDNLGTFMSTLLRSIGEYTGLHAFCVFGGPIPQFGGDLRTVTVAHGRNRGPAPCHFPQWQEKRFSKYVLEFMKEYLLTAFSPQECQESALPVDANATDPLAGANYTINGVKSGRLSDDSDSSSSASSDSESSDDSEIDGHVASKKVKPVKRGKVEKAKGGAKRKRESGMNETRPNKKLRGTSSAATAVTTGGEVDDDGEDEDDENEDDEDQDQDGGEPTLSFEQAQAMKAQRNKALLAKVDAEYALKNPQWAADREREREQKKASAPRPRKKALEGPTRRSGRLSGRDTGSEKDDVEMEDASADRGHAHLTVPRTTPELTTSPSPSMDALAPLPARSLSTSPLLASSPSAATDPLLRSLCASLPPSSSPLTATDPQVSTAPTDLFLRSLCPSPPPASSSSTGMDPPASTASTRRPPVPFPISTAAADPPPLPPSPSATPLPSSSPMSNTVSPTGAPPVSRAAAAALRSARVEEVEAVILGPESAEATDNDGIPLCIAGPGTWLADVYPEVTAKNLGDSFNALLQVWMDVEGTYGWKRVNGTAGWNGKDAHRPTELETWVRHGRGTKALGGGVGPRIVSLPVYERKWWSWWKGIQPAWRVRDSGRPDRFLREEYPEATAENWDWMHHPGPNGVLSFVATLYWWGKAVPTNGGREELESWAEAVHEVKWLLAGLLSRERGRK